MPEPPAREKSGRRPRERQAAQAEPPAAEQPAPTPRPTPEPPEATSRPEPRSSLQPPETTGTRASILHEQPAVAYTLVFALLALLLLCAFSIYMAAH